MNKREYVNQEFYCGECQGYFMVRLNIALNHEAHIRCPNCGHKHRRVIRNGEIYENGRFRGDAKENILTTMATYHKEPYTEKMKKAHNIESWGGRRDGVKLTPEIAMRWAEKAHRETTGDMSDD